MLVPWETEGTPVFSLREPGGRVSFGIVEASRVASAVSLGNSYRVSIGILGGCGRLDLK